MARTPADERFLEERDALAPLGEPAALLPTPEVDMTPPAGLPGAPTAVPTSGASPNPYGPGADAAAFEAALRDRQNADTTATFEDAATLFNKAGGGTAGDLAASTRAHRDDSFNDVMHRRAIADQDTATKKKQHEEALAAALELPDSPETKKILDFYGATTVGKAMLGNMTPEQRARLTGNMIPGAKELLASDTELMKEHLKAQTKLPGPGVDSTVATLATMLEQKFPDQFAPVKEQFLKIDPKHATAVASAFLREHQPSTTVFTDPNTGNMFGRNRKDPLTTLPTPLNGPPSAPSADPNSAPPLDTSIPVKEPGPTPTSTSPKTGPKVPVQAPGETPLDFKNRRKAIAESHPIKGWEFDPEVYTDPAAVPDKKTLAHANEIGTGATNILDFSDRVLKWLDKHPDGLLAGKSVSEIEPWLQGLTTNVRKVNDMGVYRSFDAPLIKQLVKDPTDIKNILMSAVGLIDLRKQFTTLQEESQQRAWDTFQQARAHPTRDNERWADFKPVTHGSPSAAPNRKQGKDGNWYVKGPSGWVPAGAP